MGLFVTLTSWNQSVNQEIDIFQIYTILIIVKSFTFKSVLLLSIKHMVALAKEDSETY